MVLFFALILAHMCARMIVRRRRSMRETENQKKENKSGNGQGDGEYNDVELQREFHAHQKRNHRHPDTVRGSTST